MGVASPHAPRDNQDPVVRHLISILQYSFDHTGSKSIMVVRLVILTGVLLWLRVADSLWMLYFGLPFATSIHSRLPAS